MKLINNIIPLFLLALSLNVSAECNTSILNPVTDVAWDNMFPIKIGNIVKLGNSDGSDTSPGSSNPVCSCTVAGIPKPGLAVEFWEPARVVDTVSDAWCMMPLATDVGPSGVQGTLDGGYTTREARGKIFQQSHEYVFPPLAILDLYTDLPCLEYDKSFDVAMISEVLPTWNSDILALIINPEAILFANPAAQLACAADATSAMFNRPINALYWCAGGWGSVYPLAGSATATDYVEGNALIAARMVYLMGRTGLLEEFNPNGCTRSFVKFWNKDRYKFQQMKPVRAARAVHIGKPGILWTSGKHPLVSKDNFTWMTFRKVNCCVSY